MTEGLSATEKANAQQDATTVQDQTWEAMQEAQKEPVGEASAETEQLDDADPPQEGDASDSQPPDEQGIRSVPLEKLPEPEGIEGPEDFEKVSVEQMTDGLEKLQEMQPEIDSGVGANSDYWAAADESLGLDYEHGYQRVYDSFYGGDHIRVEEYQGQVDIINGRHRIWLGKRLGYDALPMEYVKHD